MAYVDSGGVRIAFETFGDASAVPVLLVHGFASNRDGNWLRAGWARPLTDAGYHGVAVDLRGHGESDRPRSIAAYGPGRLQADLLAVLDALAVPSAHVLGYSLGARLAWELAVAHPARVRSLVVGGLPVAGSFAGYDVAQARAAVERAIETEDAATARYLAMMTAMPGNDPRALLRLAEAARRRAFRPLAPMPGQPTLIVAGTDDDLAADSEALAAAVPHAEFVPLPGRNHLDAITSRVFKTAVVEFLDRQPR
ncbi:alpha/beta fold hydrolase [Herbiconiux daphne]|uniref:Alpha/beta fold hydrolase n=1 Tax=Herbiconiux daphne TaxID=2970914 RepID=A0ABT2H8W4_9MICO|nr:alpha/beta hydrolase [Herbiconiux daphne]MCS5736344.1 alpha/beta fold hydrolase [Herbiconiux daphne]